MKRSGPSDMQSQVEGECELWSCCGCRSSHSALSLCESVNTVSVFAYKDGRVTADGIPLFAALGSFVFLCGLLCSSHCFEVCFLCNLAPSIHHLLWEYYTDGD